MFAVHRPALACALCLPLLAAAQDAASPLPQRGGEPIVQRVVTEDDGVRIEELRVRGETRRIVVRSKVGNARPYEVLPAGQGRDLSQDKRAIGQRVWPVLSF
ncbi:MAG: hypothetical protein IPM99_13175 [Rubrivivax sp.]|nr:hypothetical protein [Rubrivivax sp.]